MSGTADYPLKTSRQFDPRKVTLRYPQDYLVQPLSADFTGDGKDDLLTVSAYGDWSLLPGAAPGPTYPAEIKKQENLTVIYAANTPAVALKVDGDSKYDFVRLTKNNLFLWISNGAGFNAPVTLALPASAGDLVRLAVGDFDGDGKQEIARLTQEGLWIHKLIQVNGIWTLQNSTAAVKPSFFNSKNYTQVNLCVGDYNGDGIDDILWNDMTQGTKVAKQSGLALYPGQKTNTVHPDLATPVNYVLTGAPLTNYFSTTGGWAGGSTIVSKKIGTTLSTILVNQNGAYTLMPTNQGFISNAPSLFKTAITGGGIDVIPGDYDGDGKLDFALILPNKVYIEYGTK